jgi:hypothetical protein
MIESYADYAQYLAWALSRNITVTQTKTEIDAALYVATNDYIDVNYTFKGVATDEAQVTSLPTNQVSINSKVIRATCECAYLHLQGKLFNSNLDPLGAIKSKESSKELDVLKKSESVEYWGKASQSYLMPHPQIDKLLAPYLSNSGAGFELGYCL